MRKNKKGYSLAEVVIALTVIVAVSTAALTIVLSSMATKMAAVNKTQAQNFAHSLWECFKASESHEEFLSNIAFAENVSLVAQSTDQDGFTVYQYDSDQNKFTAIIKVNYTHTARSAFAVDINQKDGGNIVSLTYEKGDGT